VITKTISKPSWLVVEVRSGIPVDVKLFSNYETAEKYTERLRRNLNLDNDEIGVFEINLQNQITHEFC
jgi:hypothetical protein